MIFLCYFYCIFLSSRYDGILFSSTSCIDFFAFYIKVCNPSVIHFFYGAMCGLSIFFPYRCPKEPPPFIKNKSFHKRCAGDNLWVDVFLHCHVYLSVFLSILAPIRYRLNYCDFIIYNHCSSGGVCPSLMIFKYFISYAWPFAFLYKY